MSRCPRCDSEANLSRDHDTTGRRDFWRTGLCALCREDLGKTSVEQMAALVAWLGPGAGVRGALHRRQLRRRLRRY